MDRSAIAQALAKAQAYSQCGQQDKADMWARKLVVMLGSAGILRSES